MIKGVWLLFLVSLTFVFPVHAETDVKHFKFGILKEMRSGEYRIDVETTRIPRKLKETGFRFGVAFDNPSGKAIEWYEVVHLPSQLREVSGNLRQVNPKAVQTDTRRLTDPHIVDHFWFDKGDPLGKHRLEVYVNGVRRFSVDFEVVEQ